MADATQNLRNWLVAERGGEYKVFAHLEWQELGGGDWKVVADNLTEEEASKELIQRAPPEKRAS